MSSPTRLNTRAWPATGSSVTRSRALTFVGLLALVLLVFGSIKLITYKTVQIEKRHHVRRQFQLGGALGGGSEQPVLSMVSAANAASANNPANVAPVSVAGALVQQTPPTEGAVNDLTGKAVGEPAPASVIDAIPAGAPVGSSVGLVGQHDSSGGTLANVDTSVGGSVSVPTTLPIDAAASTLVGSAEVQQATSVGGLLENSIGRAPPNLAQTQPVVLEIPVATHLGLSNSILASTVDAILGGAASAIHVTQPQVPIGGSPTAGSDQLLGGALGDPSVVSAVSSIVNQLPDNNIASTGNSPVAVPTGLPVDASAVSSFMPEIAAPVPSNPADVLPSIIPWVTAPLSQTVGGTLPLSPSDESGSLGNAGRVVDPTTTQRHEPLCLVNQMTNDALRQAIRPCSDADAGSIASVLPPAASAPPVNIPLPPNNVLSISPNSPGQTQNFPAPAAPAVGNTNQRGSQSSNPVGVPTAGSSNPVGSKPPNPADVPVPVTGNSNQGTSGVINGAPPVNANPNQGNPATNPVDGNTVQTIPGVPNPAGGQVPLDVNPGNLGLPNPAPIPITGTQDKGNVRAPNPESVPNAGNTNQGASPPGPPGTGNANQGNSGAANPAPGVSVVGNTNQGNPVSPNPAVATITGDTSQGSSGTTSPAGIPVTGNGYQGVLQSPNSGGIPSTRNVNQGTEGSSNPANVPNTESPNQGSSGVLIPAPAMPITGNTNQGNLGPPNSESPPVAVAVTGNPNQGSSGTSYPWNIPGPGSVVNSPAGNQAPPLVGRPGGSGIPDQGSVIQPGWFCELVIAPEATGAPVNSGPVGPLNLPPLGLVNPSPPAPGPVKPTLPGPVPPNGGAVLGPGQPLGNGPSPGNGQAPGNSPAPGNPQAPNNVPTQNGSPAPAKPPASGNGSPSSNGSPSPDNSPPPNQGPAPSTPATGTPLVPNNGPDPANPAPANPPTPGAGQGPNKNPTPGDVQPAPGNTPPPENPHSGPATGPVSTPAGGVAPGGVSNPENDPVFRPGTGSMPSSIAPIVLGWNYLGCFEDAISRTLIGARPQDNMLGVMSNGNCINHCRSRGCPFSGTEDGQECWCGTAIRDDAVRLPQDYCELPCQGSLGTACGGDWAVLVYYCPDAAPVPPLLEYRTIHEGSIQARKDATQDQASNTATGGAPSGEKIGIREMRKNKRHRKQTYIDVSAKLQEPPA
ncbi:Fc.00g023030.m01.CDS01 [Cosmosporella sp. VM-42]